MGVDDLLIVYVTCPADESEKIAETLVNEKLAACVNILPAKSIYVWDNKLCRDEENLMIIKTLANIFEKLEARIKQLHSYTTPEIVAIKAEAVQKDYLKWVHEQTQA
jgi:periplasmic divalent cation tolerance protein